MGHVTLTNLTKRYGNETAVEDVNLDINDGEFVTIVGPSGCGKSTTMEMLAGLTDVTEGTVTIDGTDVTNVPPKDRNISMVFQNIALFPHMNVRDNISFGLRIRGHDDEEIDRRVARAAETVQIEGMEDRMPDQLSGGQRQRVAIARAIVREPEVFLMDEPLANLDAALRVHMRTELQRLHDELETTIIYVTHDQEEAMTMSNRLAVMNDGRVQQFDTPLRCYNRPANRFVAGFIGSPSMNFIEGRTTDAGLSTPYFDLKYATKAAETGAFEFDDDETDRRESTVDDTRSDRSAAESTAPDGGGALETGRDVTVGIRPEDVALLEAQEDLENPSEPFAASVDVVEPIGKEVFLYLLLEGRDDSTVDPAELLVSTPPNPDWDMEEMRRSTVDVCVDLARVHLFDPESGEALVHGLTKDLDDGSLNAASS